MDPPLTVISQPMEKMGKSTMELLLARLRGAKPAQTIVFTPELIVRQSTAPPGGKRVGGSACRLRVTRVGLRSRTTGVERS